MAQVEVAGRLTGRGAHPGSAAPGAAVPLRALVAVDAGMATVLSVFGLAITMGWLATGFPHGGLLAGLLVLPGTLAVAVCRRWPLPAAVAAPAGAVGGWLATGTMVRCGALLPAAFWVACVGGLELSRRRSFMALALVAGSIVVQSVSDPDIPPLTLILMLPVATGFWAMGRLLHSRNRVLADIRLHNASIIETRRRSAELAVASDRARIAEGVVAGIADRISAIQHSAEQLRTHPRDPGNPSAFAGIAEDGRAVLARLRESVGTLREVEGEDRYRPGEEPGTLGPGSARADRA